jgi:hypothetical protein
MKMEAEYSYQTLVIFNQTIRSQNPEGNNIVTCISDYRRDLDL